MIGSLAQRDIIQFATNTEEGITPSEELFLQYIVIWLKDYYIYR